MMARGKRRDVDGQKRVPTATTIVCTPIFEKADRNVPAVGVRCLVRATWQTVEFARRKIGLAVDGDKGEEVVVMRNDWRESRRR